MRKHILISGLFLSLVLAGCNFSIAPKTDVDTNNVVTNNNGTLLALDIKKASPSGSVTEIDHHSLSLENSVQIVYYVKNTVSSVDSKGLLIWDTYQNDYSYATAQYKLTSSEVTNIESVDHDTYYFSNVAAKRMTKYYYAVSYVEVGGVYTYSSVDRYSVLDYCYNKKGNTSKASSKSNKTLGELVEEILEYGAFAQQYFDEDQTRLANDHYFKVTISGGIFKDGFKTRLCNSIEYVDVVATTSESNVDFIWWLDDSGNVCSISEDQIRFGAYSSDITITSKFESRDLTSLWDIQGDTVVRYFGNETNVTLPTICGGVLLNNVGDSCFQGKTCIESVYIPDGYKTIGMSAFEACTSLANVRIPDSLQSVDFYAFDECTSLIKQTDGKGVYIGDTNNRYALLVGPSTSIDTTLTINDNCVGVCKSAFSKNASIESVVFSSSVNFVGSSAFYQCSNLSDVTFKVGLETIEKWAFQHDSEIATLDLPASVKDIQDGAFSYCLGVKQITLPISLEKVGIEVFFGIDINDLDKGKTLSENCIYLGSPANKYLLLLKASNRDLSLYTINSSCKIVYYQAFYGCSFATNITIPNSVTFIGQEAFSTCGLENVNMPNNLVYLGSSAYHFCKFTSVVIPESVQEIEPFAFACCDELVEATLPSHMMEIPDYIFSGCKKLAKVNHNRNITRIGDHAFDSCLALTDYVIPQTVEEMGSDPFSEITGFPYQYDGTCYYYGPESNPYKFVYKALSSSTITLNSNCRAICKDTFNNGDNICTNLVLNSGLEYIFAGAFGAFKNIASLTIPSSLKKIDVDNFYSMKTGFVINMPYKLSECPRSLADWTLKSFVNWQVE